MPGRRRRKPSSSIMNLPAEILMMIFDFFTPRVIIHPETRGQCWCVLFSLRSTCRRFRALVNELPIWFDSNFKLVEVIPGRRSWFTNDGPEEYDAGFLRLLFQDQHLVQCLERRTSWHFKNLESLVAVIERVPSFSRGATSLGFSTV